MFIGYNYYFIIDDLFIIMKSCKYKNIPFLQLNIIDADDGKYFKVFNLNYPYDAFVTDSLNDLLDYINVNCLDEM